MRVALLSALLLLAISFSACTRSGAKTDAGAATSASSAAPATITTDTGGIEGTVTDDEVQPIAGVDVIIVSTELATKTDAQGKFSFSNLEPASYQLAFNKLGYDNFAKKVEVKAGEVTPANIVLKVLEIVEVYPELSIYKGYIKLGTALTAAAEADGGVILGCEKCRNKFKVNKTVQTVIFEALFKPALPDPREMKLYTQTRADGKLLINDDWPNRGRFELTEGWSKGEFDQFIACGNVSFSICYEQSFEIYTTQYHNGPAPDGYSGLPPPG